MTERDRHLTDAELIGVVDREPTTDAAHSHLARCAECAASVAAIRRESVRVSRWLDRAAFEDGDGAVSAGAPSLPTTASPPRSRGRPGRRAADGHRPRRVAPWLRAAAILALLAAPVAALPGVRGWVADRVLGGSETAANQPAVETVETVAERPTVLRFVPDAGTFRVRIDRGPTAFLVLERGAEGSAELRLQGPRPEATVSATSLRLRPRAGQRYVLRLPPAVTAVRVEVADRAIDVSAAEITAGTTLDLPPATGATDSSR